MKTKVIIWGLVGIICAGFISLGLSIDQEYGKQRQSSQQELQLQIDTIHNFLRQIESNLVVLDSSLDALLVQSKYADSVAQVHYVIIDKRLKGIIQMIDKQQKNK